MRHLKDKLKALRLNHHLTLQELADKSGLTKSYLSKLERGVCEPSASTVIKLSAAFAVTTSYFMEGIDETPDEYGDDGQDGQWGITRLDESAMAYSFYGMLGSAAGARVDPFIVRPPLSESRDETVFPHKGVEFAMVLSGRVRVTTDGRCMDLAAGQSVAVDATLPHAMLSLDGVVARVLLVVFRSGN